MTTPKYQYAQLPVFKYQVYDRESTKFSYVPIIPPVERPPVDYDDAHGTGEGSETIDEPPPQDVAVAEPPAELIQGKVLSFETSNSIIFAQP